MRSRPRRSSELPTPLATESKASGGCSAPPPRPRTNAAVLRLTSRAFVGESLETAHEQADPEPGRPARGMGQVLLGERGAGDVEMRPACAADELLEKEPRDDRPRRVAAHVLQVGDRALQIVTVLGDEGEVP